MTSPCLPFQIHWAGFDSIQLTSSEFRKVLLLTYANGFQVWDVQDAVNVRELVSRRDGHTSCLNTLPLPTSPDPADSPLRGTRPLLAVVTTDGDSHGRGGGGGGGGGGGDDGAGEGDGVNGGCGKGRTGGGGMGMDGGSSQLPLATAVRIYSLKRHAYVHTLGFSNPVVAVRCSSRLVAVALQSAQVGAGVWTQC